MKKYEIEWTRLYFASGECVVEADSEEDAREKWKTIDRDPQGGLQMMDEDEIEHITLIEENK